MWIKGEDRGVLFLGRLPHGFYEDQLKAYFAQFGNVTRLRVSRNKKVRPSNHIVCLLSLTIKLNLISHVHLNLQTGKSKHYGFIEFDSSAVAQIVADTMDNYLLMGHILRCKVIPKDDVHPELWVGANRKWRVVPKDRVARAEHDKVCFNCLRISFVVVRESDYRSYFSICSPAQTLNRPARTSVC